MFTRLKRHFQRVPLTMFIDDPYGFMHRVRAMGSEAEARLGPLVVTMVNDPDRGQQILKDQSMVVMDRGFFRRFIGDAALLEKGEKHRAARRVVVDMGAPLTTDDHQADLKQRLQTAVREAGEQGKELGEVIRDILIRWALKHLMVHQNNLEEAVEVSKMWLELANNPALFDPFERPPWKKNGRSWLKMILARRRLVRLMGHKADRVKAGQALLLLVGILDNPVTLALGALKRWQSIGWHDALTAEQVVDLVLKYDPPLPYAVRQDAKGRRFMVDLRFIRKPPGDGGHRCPFVELGEKIAIWTAQAIKGLSDRYEFVVTGEGRTRFAVGVQSGTMWPKTA